MPLLERCSWMEGRTVPVTIHVEKASAKDGTPIDVEVSRQTLEGRLRAMVATLSPEQVNEDRLRFAHAVAEVVQPEMGKLGPRLDTFKILRVSDAVECDDSLGRARLAEVLRDAAIAEAEDDLQRLGLDLDSLQITAITDDARFLDSLGRPQHVELLRQSRIAEAKAIALARIKEAEQDKVTELVGLRRDEAIARVEAELPMQAERIAMVANQLQADVVAPADADGARDVAAARGKAAAILEEGSARAEGLSALVASWQQAGPDARALDLTQRLQPPLAQVQAATGFDPARWLRERGMTRPEGVKGGEGPEQRRRQPPVS